MYVFSWMQKYKLIASDLQINKSPVFWQRLAYKLGINWHCKWHKRDRYWEEDCQNTKIAYSDSCTPLSKAVMVDKCNDGFADFTPILIQV